MVNTSNSNLVFGLYSSYLRIIIYRISNRKTPKELHENCTQNPCKCGRQIFRCLSIAFGTIMVEAMCARVFRTSTDRYNSKTSMEYKNSALIVLHYKFSLMLTNNNAQRREQTQRGRKQQKPFRHLAILMRYELNMMCVCARKHFQNEYLTTETQ